MKKGLRERNLHSATNALGIMGASVCKLAAVAADVAGATFALVVQENRLHGYMLGVETIAHVAYVGAMFPGAGCFAPGAADSDYVCQQIAFFATRSGTFELDLSVAICIQTASEKFAADGIGCVVFLQPGR